MPLIFFPPCPQLCSGLVTVTRITAKRSHSCNTVSNTPATVRSSRHDGAETCQSSVHHQNDHQASPVQVRCILTHAQQQTLSSRFVGAVLSGGSYVGCATCAAQQGTSVPSCTCLDHQQMIWLQQHCSRCLHRNAPETVVVILHRRKVVDVEAAVTCELTSVQARQPWLCWQSVWAVPPLWGDFRGSCQVLVDVCMSMWAMLLQCYVQVWQQVCHQISRSCFLDTRSIAELWQFPCFTGRPAAAMCIHQHGFTACNLSCSVPPKAVCRLQSPGHRLRIVKVAALLAIFCSSCSS